MENGNENQMTPVAMALALTKGEEVGAIRSTVAWAMCALDLRLGWTAPVRAGMDGKTAIKVLRETYGYRLDMDGQPILDARGNRAKRSAIFNRLALVEKIVSYMVKATPAYITELHAAAVIGDGERMQEVVFAIGAALCSLSGDDTLDALGFFLANGKAKPAKVEPIADAVAALAETETKKETVPNTVPQIAMESGFGDVLAWLAQNKMTMTATQWGSVLELGAAEMLQRSEIAAKEEAEKIAA